MEFGPNPDSFQKVTDVNQMNPSLRGTDAQTILETALRLDQIVEDSARSSYTFLGKSLACTRCFQDHLKSTERIRMKTIGKILINSNSCDKKKHFISPLEQDLASQIAENPDFQNFESFSMSEAAQSLTILNGALRVNKEKTEKPFYFLCRTSIQNLQGQNIL